LIQIWDCKDRIAFDQLPHSQFGMHGRNYLYPPSERRKLNNQRIVSVGNNTNQRTWPSVEAVIDVKALKEDPILFDFVFQSFDRETREHLYASFQSDNPHYRLFLDTTCHREAINKKEKATLRKEMKKRSEYVKEKVRIDRKNNLFATLTDTELTRMYEAKYVSLTHKMKRTQGHGNSIDNDEHYIAFDKPWMFHFKGKKLYTDPHTRSIDLWGTGDYTSVGKSENVQLFEGRTDWKSSHQDWLSRVQFPSRWQHIVTTLQCIFEDYYNKSRHSAEISLILKEIMPWAIPYPEND
jgi:hypothetical protein